MNLSPSSATRAIGISVAVSVVVGLLIAWFSWPATELAPRDLPVVVAGPAPAASAVAQRLASVEDGAFEVTTVANEAAADRALRDRTAYAAFIVGPTGMSLHTASGASPTVANLLTMAAQQLAAQQPGGQQPGGQQSGGQQSGGQVTVVDVVPGSPDDARGAGFASGLLPLVLVGMLIGVLLFLLVSTTSATLLGLGLASLLVGATGAGVLHALGVLAGSYFAAAGVVALLVLAVSATVAGLAAVLGRLGVALGALLVFVIANPISAVAAAPELLPQPWGAIGQLLPPGAGATLLRSAAFFDGAGAAAPLWTLVAWAGAGLALVALGGLRTKAAAAPAPAELAHAA